MDTHVVDSTTIYKTCIAWCAEGWVFEMYFFEGGICITTPAHSADARPPPPLLICSRVHLFTTYLDVETYTLTSRYLMPSYNPLVSRHITLASRGVGCLFIVKEGDPLLNTLSLTFSNMLTNIIARYNSIYVLTYHDMMMHCIGVAYFAPLQSKRRIFLSWYDDMILNDSVH